MEAREEDDLQRSDRESILSEGNLHLGEGESESLSSTYEVIRKNKRYTIQITYFK